MIHCLKNSERAETRPAYSDEFDRLRKNRVAVSYHKYGPARKNFGEGRVDALATAQLCLDAFRRDHNTEHLVDAANQQAGAADTERRGSVCLQAGRL